MIHKFEEIQKDSSIARQHLRLHRRGSSLGRPISAPTSWPQYRTPRSSVSQVPRSVARTHGSGSFQIFGSQDEDGYLDQYSIIESITDETTLPIKYKLAPSSMRMSTRIWTSSSSPWPTRRRSPTSRNSTSPRYARLASGRFGRRRPRRERGQVRRRALSGERLAARLQGILRRRRPRKLRQVQARARSVPAAGVVRGDLQHERQRHRRPAGLSPSSRFREAREGSRRSSSRSPTRSPRS